MACAVRAGAARGLGPQQRDVRRRAAAPTPGAPPVLPSARADCVLRRPPVPASMRPPHAPSSPTLHPTDRSCGPPCRPHAWTETTEGAGGVTHPTLGIPLQRVPLQSVYAVGDVPGLAPRTDLRLFLCLSRRFPERGRGELIFKRLRRRPPPLDPAAERRFGLLERRVAHLEALLEGLQDAVHREAVRRDEETARLERRTTAREMGRALSEDARKRGLQ